jgi:phage shock protein PspC (stress-responsive transcriptional regulator)
MPDRPGEGQPDDMTTTDSGWIPPAPPPPSTQPRVLRRSRSDRVGAGVSGGLGHYFNLDPVLFRVLFAVSAFFGGAGVLAYVIAWAAIPEEGAVHAPIDRFIGELRRRHIPVWLVVLVGSILLWVVAFSWWAPGPFLPVIAVVILLVAVFGRRGATNLRTASDGAPTVSLQKDAADGTAETSALGAPDWVGSTRAWMNEAKQASRERRRRAFPVRISVLTALAITLTILGIADGVSGIRLPVYFWVTSGIVGLGLIVGMVLRRTPWSMVPLLVPALAGMIAFGNSHSSLHDGIGQKDWTPASASDVRSDYRLAFGQGILDLRHIGTVSIPHDIDITMAAGQVKLLLPSDMNATVYANVRIGEIEVDGTTVADSDGGSFHRTHGYDIDHTVVAPTGATGSPITITVHLADGNVTVDHQN